MNDVQSAECKVQSAGPDGQGERQRNIGKRVRYRRRGNVARLAKAVRDRVNQMIDDGVPYREIIEQLGEEGKKVSKFNLSKWRKGGYKDWLAERAFIERTRARQETPADMVRDFDGTEVNHAALQLGTLHIFEALRDLGPGTLNDKLGGDCGAFARLLNALARASRETMLLQKYREAVAQARKAMEPMMDPRRELTDQERHAIVRHVDRILGIGQTPHDFEHQTPATGIIRLDRPPLNGKPKSESRSPKEGRTPNSEEAFDHETHKRKNSLTDSLTH